MQIQKTILIITATSNALEVAAIKPGDYSASLKAAIKQITEGNTATASMEKYANEQLWDSQVTERDTASQKEYANEELSDSANEQLWDSQVTERDTASQEEYPNEQLSDSQVTGRFTASMEEYANGQLWDSQEELTRGGESTREN